MRATLYNWATLLMVRYPNPTCTPRKVLIHSQLDRYRGVTNSLPSFKALRAWARLNLQYDAKSADNKRKQLDEMFGD